MRKTIEHPKRIRNGRWKRIGCNLLGTPLYECTACYARTIDHMLIKQNICPYCEMRQFRKDDDI